MKKVTKRKTGPVFPEYHGGEKLPSRRWGEIDRCVCCGVPIPEGRMVCWQCEHPEENT